MIVMHAGDHQASRARTRRVAAAGLTLLLAGATSAAAQQWPSFRGPQASGVAAGPAPVATTFNVPSGDAVLAEVLSSYRQAADGVTGGEGWKEGVRGAIRPSRGKFSSLAPERQAYVLGRTRPLERRPNRPEHRP